MERARDKLIWLILSILGEVGIIGGTIVITILSIENSAIVINLKSAIFLSLGILCRYIARGIETGEIDPWSFD